jgi:hypothetical protein
MVFVIRKAIIAILLWIRKSEKYPGYLGLSHQRPEGFAILIPQWEANLSSFLASPPLSDISELDPISSPASRNGVALPFKSF